MGEKRISHAQGKGSLTHNNRLFNFENVNPNRTKDNVIYIQEDLAEAYSKCFNASVEAYNARQTRSDRKVKDYYTHLFGEASQAIVATSQNKEKSFYEIVVGVGDKDTCGVGTQLGEIVKVALDEYARGFQERNPNFYVFNSVLHMDEKTPHLHIDYIPIADSYKRGLSVRNSQTKALEQMGYGIIQKDGKYSKHENPMNSWRISERQILREICLKHGIEIAEEEVGRGKTLSPREYKQVKEIEIEKAKREIKTEIDDFKKQISLEKERWQKAHYTANLEQVRILELKEEEKTLNKKIKDLKSLISNLQKENELLKDETTKFTPTVNDLRRVLEIQKNSKKTTFGVSRVLSQDDFNFLIKLSKQNAEISEITMQALADQKDLVDQIAEAQLLYLTIATALQTVNHVGDRDQLRNRVADVLKGGIDNRVVSWLLDDMTSGKPSSLEELERHQGLRIKKAYEKAQKLYINKQPVEITQQHIAPKVTPKKKPPSHER